MGRSLAVREPEAPTPPGTAAFYDYVRSRSAAGVVEASAVPLDPNSPDLAGAPAFEVFADPPAPIRHIEPGAEQAQAARAQSDQLRRQLAEEKLTGNWYAALVDHTIEPPAIGKRFPDKGSLEAFLVSKKAIVEEWVYTPEANDTPLGFPGKRLPHSQLSALARAGEKPPTFTVIAHRELGGGVRRERLEFGQAAARQSLATKRAYLHHRELQETGRRLLRTRGADGQLSANAQWAALRSAVSSGRFPLAELPQPPADDSDFLMAFEFKTDALGKNFTAPVRGFRRSEIRKGVVDGVQFVKLHPPQQAQPRFGLGFHVGVTDDDRMVAAIHPIAGEDVVEVRLFDPSQSDERRWNVLDFGEPEVVRERGLANYGLIQGYLEKRQKHRAWKKANLDIVAESVIVGLNVGGGLNGSPTPVGESVRLAYNATIGTRYLRPVPEVDDYQALAQQLQGAPAVDRGLSRFINRDDLDPLSDRLSRMSSTTLGDTLKAVDGHDVLATAKLARGQAFDERYKLGVNILTSLGKVTKETESGVLKSIFNNSWLSPDGELSIKNSIALAAGNETITPRSGVSLESLADGGGPRSAWWQFLDFSVDLRAVANSISMFRNRDRSDRELLRPFPHAPLLGDLSAYEVRGFGFPGLIFHKRRLARRDMDAYLNTFAYAVLGARIVERFPTKDEVEAAVRAGTMAPLGFASVADQNGTLRQSNLPVFGHRLSEGRYAGRTALVLFGLEAFRSHSEYMEREHERTKKHEAALVEGGVIEATDSEAPAIYVGSAAMRERYSSLLDALLEHRRALRFASWGGNARALPERTAAELRARGVAVAGGRDPLRRWDTNTGTFTYERANGDLVEVTLVPSLADIERDLARAKEEILAEQRRLATLAGKPSTGTTPSP